MNSLRDPFAIRSKPALTILIQRAATAGAEAASKIPTLETIADQSRQLADNTQAKLESLAESMSFSVPRNVPSFTSPNRDREDQIWTAVTGRVHSPKSPHARGSSIGLGNITGAAAGTVGSLFREKELPMYKDKPYYYTGSYRRKRIWQQKKFWVLLLLMVFGLYWLGILSRDEEVRNRKIRYFKGGKWFWKSENKVDWDERRERVKEAFLSSWNSYERNAWGIVSL